MKYNNLPRYFCWLFYVVSMFMLSCWGFFEFQCNLCLDRFPCCCVQRRAFNIHATHPNTHTQRTRNTHWMTTFNNDNRQHISTNDIITPRTSQNALWVGLWLGIKPVFLENPFKKISWKTASDGLRSCPARWFPLFISHLFHGFFLTHCKLKLWLVKRIIMNCPNVSLITG